MKVFDKRRRRKKTLNVDIHRIEEGTFKIQCEGDAHLKSQSTIHLCHHRLQQTLDIRFSPLLSLSFSLFFLLRCYLSLLLPPSLTQQQWQQSFLLQESIAKHYLCDWHKDFVSFEKQRLCRTISSCSSSYSVKCLVYEYTVLSRIAYYCCFPIVHIQLCI